MSHALDLTTLTEAVRSAVAIRASLRLQPAGGPGTKVFPPTYAASEDRRDRERFGEHRYATEIRRIDGRDVPCVLLDSVASQANRMELALLDGWQDEVFDFPLVRVDFSTADATLPAPVGEITSLDAPHRIYDAILRDSVDADGTLFRYTPAGEAITHATVRDATALYRYCPTALVFGAWDSTGPKGGLGSKFQRCLTSEIVGIDVQVGTKVGGRIDPLGIEKKAGPVFKSDDADGWSLDKPGKKAKEGKPSDINHGNIAPTRDVEGGGVTFDHALQTTVLSLPALRRLKFPRDVDGETHEDRAAAQLAARTALAALALAGVAGAHAEGHDLRSGALLVGEGPLTLEILGATGAVEATTTLGVDDASALLADAVAAAEAKGMGWTREPLPALAPADKLVALLQRSQALSAAEAPQGEGSDA